jgi:hypothetical protein
MDAATKRNIEELQQRTARVADADTFRSHKPGFWTLADMQSLGLINDGEVMRLNDERQAAYDERTRRDSEAWRKRDSFPVNDLSAETLSAHAAALSGMAREAHGHAARAANEEQARQKKQIHEDARLRTGDAREQAYGGYLNYLTSAWKMDALSARKGKADPEPGKTRTAPATGNAGAPDQGASPYEDFKRRLTEAWKWRVSHL